MRVSFKLLLVTFLVTVMAGCAGPTSKSGTTNLFCAVGGALVGGAAMGAVAEDSAEGEAALAGAAVGAMLALVLCPDDEPEAAPMVEAAPVCDTIAPPGAHQDINGCPYDTDMDGVYDGIDLCQNTPEGVTVDRVGCPLDSDGDAVPDYRDLCPGTPKGVLVDQDGCPLPGENILSLTGVNFAFDKATLTADAQAILDEAVVLLKETDDIVEVRVEGHTDSIGSEAYNQDLSQRRAEAVVEYLSAQGVDGNNLIPVGMGENFPVAGNDTEAGRAANRRVDFVINQ
jgi:OOP family OmpA-OmpF porin